jgi:hypothetical protein
MFIMVCLGSSIISKAAKMCRFEEWYSSSGWVLRIDSELNLLKHHSNSVSNFTMSSIAGAIIEDLVGGTRAKKGY